MGYGVLILVGSSVTIILGGLGLFFWAFYSGQFDRIRKDSLLPFDDEEPAGKRTDQIFEKRSEDHESDYSEE